MIRVSVTEAMGRLSDLVRRAEAGDEVVLTRRGRDVARLSPIKARPIAVAERRRILDEARASGAARRTKGPDAARSQDFLYDEDGLPG